MAKFKVRISPTVHVYYCPEHSHDMGFLYSRKCEACKALNKAGNFEAWGENGYLLSDDPDRERLIRAMESRGWDVDVSNEEIRYLGT